MSLLQNIISQSSNTESSVKERVVFYPDLFRISDGLVHKPGMLWHDGKTFFSAHKSQVYNNQIQALRYNHSTKDFYWTLVGVGTDIRDIYDHPAAWLWIEGNKIYYGQTNTHIDPIDRFRSNIDNDITSGFAKLTSIPGTNSYPHFVLGHDGTLLCCVRAIDMDTCLQISDSGIEGTFTLTQITDRNSEHADRYYNQIPTLYGTNTKTYVFSMLRNEDTGVYYANVPYVTYDYQTYYNITETWSKDVTIAPLSVSEIETNYSIYNGSRADRSAVLNYAHCIQVNDVLYMAGIKYGTTDLYVFRTEDGVTTSTLLDIPNIYGAELIHSCIMRWNGFNLVFSVLTDDGSGIKKELWAAPIDLSFFSKKFEFKGLNDRVIDLPENLHEVEGEYAFELGTDENLNKLVLGLTEDKWML